MIWYKSWLDTRWRFLIGLAILLVMAVGVVFDYSLSAQLIATAGRNPDAVTSSPLLREAIRIEQTYRGWVWYQWYRQNLAQTGTLFAIVLGSRGLSVPREGLFTMSLPVSRMQWTRTRAATGLGEFLVLATVPSLAISFFSPMIGQHAAITDVFAYGLCTFVAAAVFYSLAFLLSTVFPDAWRPLLLAVAIACVLGILEARFDFSGLFRVMSGHTYFESGSFPWIGLTSSAAVSVALLYGAAANIARKDF